MAVVVELARESGTQEHTLDGQQSATRVFLVNVFEDAAARSAPGVPRPGESHPDYSGLIARRVRTEPDGNRNRRVVVEYSITTGGTITPPDRTADAYIRRSWDFAEEDILLPVFVFSPMVLVGGTTPQTSNVWQPSTPERYVRENRMIYRITVNVPTLTYAQVLAVSEQNNQIHVFGGQKWLFLVGSVQAVSDRLDQIAYEWKNDTGTPPYPNIDPDISMPTIFRDPFYRYEIVASPDLTNRATPPTVLTTPRYFENPDGWMNLPGSERF